jgi:hypothetical protein
LSTSWINQFDLIALDIEVKVETGTVSSLVWDVQRIAMLAFIHIHKTAGTTIQWILRSTYGLNHCEGEPWDPCAEGLEPWETYLTAEDLRRSAQVYQSLKSVGGHFVQPHSDLEDFCPGIKYFAFVRDPLKHRASMFQHGVLAQGDGLNLDVWLQEEQSSNRQTKMIAGVPDVATAIRLIQDKEIFVGLTDRFDESMVLFKHLVASDLNIMYRPMRVTSDKSVTRSLLNDERTRHMLMEGNQADKDLYDYVKRELYPSYQHAFGSSLGDCVEAYQASLAPYKHQGVSVTFLEKSLLHKMLLGLRLAPFDSRKVMLSLLKTYLVHKLMILAYRKGLNL